MKSKIDVVIVGRPDHSMLIYSELLKQSQLSFRFIVFKVLPSWCKRFTRHLRVQFVDKNSIIGIRLTIISILRNSFKFKWATNFSEKGKLERKFRFLTKKHHINLIHYWGNYANDAIEKYKEENSDAIILKDIHMPCYQTVLDVMRPICLKYNLQDLLDRFENAFIEEQKELRNVTCAVAPSQYVVDSFKEFFPNIKFHVVPYGIMRSSNYKKRHLTDPTHRFKFVYAGSITLQKGCDLLIDYFSKHREYELHLYGQLSETQSNILLEKKTDNIYLHGVVGKNIIQQEFSKYDVGIHLSRFDAYSLSVGEEIGSGLPVIVSCTTGIECDVRRYNWGLVTDFESKDLDDIVKTMTDVDVYNRFADSIDEYFNSSQPGFGKEMVTLYTQLIDFKHSNSH